MVLHGPVELAGVIGKVKYWAETLLCGKTPGLKAPTSDSEGTAKTLLSGLIQAEALDTAS
jgi:hypothetical protein